MQSNFILKSLKGKNSFTELYQNGKYKTNQILTINYSKEISQDKIIYFAVSSPKKINRKAVTRNRIKRLLRVATNNYIRNLDENTFVPSRFVAIWRRTEIHPRLLGLQFVSSNFNQVFDKVIGKSMENEASSHSTNKTL